MKQLAILTILSFFNIILQQTLFSIQLFADVKPELFTILIVFYSFQEKNKNRGIILSSLVGLIEDIFTGQILGFNMLLKSLFFLFISFFKEKIFVQNYFCLGLLILVLNFLEFWLGYALFNQFNPFSSLYKKYLLIYIIIIPISLFCLEKLKKFFLDENTV